MSIIIREISASLENSSRGTDMRKKKREMMKRAEDQCLDRQIEREGYVIDRYMRG